MPTVPVQPERPSADKIHELALSAEKNLEGLATELAHAGADPEATKAVGRMADICRKIASQMAKGGTDGPPPPEAQPAPDQAGPPTMHSAANDLQAGLAAKRAQGY